MTMAIRMKKQDPVSIPDFIEAMGGASTQVTVVSTNGAAGRFGVTVSAFASVSAEPPLVLVCVNRNSPTVDAIRENGCFCVNVLATEQSTVSDCFAGRPATGAPYDFNCADWSLGQTGSPMLHGATSNFDCFIESSHNAGTHCIFVGRVVQTATTQAPPLAFSRRTYQALSPIHRKDT